MRTHGSSAYREGCRCDVCIEGNRKYQRDYRARNRKRKQSGTGRGRTKLDVEALASAPPIDHDRFWERVRAEGRLRDLARYEVL